jgi:secondary thiamine-phosphate synthase enzyme
MGCSVYTKRVTISTSSRFEVVRITDYVESAVDESGIKDGLVIIHVPHATAAIIANEYEPRIIQDYIAWIKKAVPPGAGWKHDMIDDNAHAHIASAFIGATRTFPVVNGGIMRGTWQEIMLLELDGPRARRNIIIQVMGTKE